MAQLREGVRRASEPTGDEAMPSPTLTRRRVRPAALLRTLGAVAVLVVGAVHLEQYYAIPIRDVPTIGPLFLLNFIGATTIGLGLLIPSARLDLIHVLLALAGVGLAATSFIFLFVSEYHSLFGFQESGYRPAILVALAAEAATICLLGGYLMLRAGLRN